ncbi:MAG: Flp pilus assembly protein CpaB [Polyangia bacterium]
MSFRNRGWIAALALGLVAGGLHLAYLRALAAEERGGEPVEVLVAAADVSRGEVLAERRVAVQSIPAAFADGRAVPADRVEDVLGLETSIEIEAGQRILWSDFAERPDPKQSDLARLIEPGQRAMAIPVDSSLSMSGMLRPGHRVDILGTFSKQGRDEKVTVTLLQNVTVLATGSKLRGAEDGQEGRRRYDTATLSVGMEEAELLAFAADHGTLSLVLRGYQDLEVVRDVPEKGQADVWEAERRNALQTRARKAEIERLAPR